MKQVGTCYGFNGKVQQVPRNFIAPITVLREKCYRCPRIEVHLLRFQWESAVDTSEFHCTCYDFNGKVQQVEYQSVNWTRTSLTVRQTLTLNCA